MVETTWQTQTGWLIVRDALVMGPWHNIDERSRTHRRTPTDCDAEHFLLRTVHCVSGVGRPVDDLRAGVRLRAAQSATWEYAGGGVRRGDRARRQGPGRPIRRCG